MSVSVSLTHLFKTLSASLRFFFCFVWMNCFCTPPKWASYSLENAVSIFIKIILDTKKEVCYFLSKFRTSQEIFVFFLIGYFLTCNSHFPPCHTLYNLLTGNIFYVLAFPSILCCISNLFGHFLPCWFLIHIQRKLEILDICHQNIFVFLLKSWLKFMFQHFFDYCILQQFYTRLKICNYDLRMYNIIVRTTL